MNAPTLKLSALITGELCADPQDTITANNKPCVKIQIQTESMRVFATAMFQSADDLLPMRSGDQVAVTGRLSVSLSEFKGAPSLFASMFITRVLPLSERKQKKPEAKRGKFADMERDDPPFSEEAGRLDDVGAFERQGIPA